MKKEGICVWREGEVPVGINDWYQVIIDMDCQPSPTSQDDFTEEEINDPYCPKCGKEKVWAG